MCIILLAFGFAISLMFKKYSYVPTDTTSKVMTTEEKKQEVISRLNTTSTKPLTGTERSYILDFVTSPDVRYTEEERANITRLLREAK